MCNLHFATTNTKVHGIFCVSFEAKNVLVSQDTTAVPVQNKLITKAVVFYEFLFMFFFLAADDIGSLREIFDKKNTMELSEWNFTENISSWKSETINDQCYTLLPNKKLDDWRILWKTENSCPSVLFYNSSTEDGTFLALSQLIHIFFFSSQHSPHPNSRKSL